jgi:hypothetical protein
MSELTRDVTTKECFWLDADLPAGTEVHVYDGCTYGCIGAGIAVTLEPNKTPFFEVPRDAVSQPTAEPQEKGDE